MFGNMFVLYYICNAVLYCFASYRQAIYKVKLNLKLMFKKFFVAAAAVLFTLGASAQASVQGGDAAQGGVPSFWKNVVIEFGVGAGTGHGGMSPLELGGTLGYRFLPRLYAFAHGGCLYGMYDKEHGRLYTKNATLAGGLGYTLFRVGNVDLDLRASAGGSVGNADWKHTVYDGGVAFRIGGIGRLKLNVGLGYRHVTSHTAGIGAYNGLYGTIGVGF